MYSRIIGRRSDRFSGPHIGARALTRLAVLIGIAFFFVFPYLWLAGSAFRPREEIFRYVNPVSWRTFIPVEPTLDNFRHLFVELNFGRALANSFFIAVVTVTITLFICSMIAFAIARINFPGREIVFTLILATILIPFETIMVSVFLTIQRLGLFDTYPAIILPWVADAFIIFLFRQHFREIPDELQDAAIVDGCSLFRVYWNVMLPNIRPALVSAAFIKFVFSWDAFIWPLIVTRDPDLTVIQLAISRLFTDQNVLWELIFAGAFIGTVPLILLFLFLQRYYIEGVVSSGIK